MSFVLVVPQPWAHWLLTGQINALPGCRRMPPQEACGERVGVVSDGVDWNATQRLLDRFPALTIPTCGSMDDGAHAVWLKRQNDSPGKWKNGRDSDWAKDRHFVKNDAYGQSVLTFCRFRQGALGSALLAGWLWWELNEKKPSRQYKPPGARPGQMRLHRCAHGPYAWVLRRPSEADTIKGVELRPLEGKLNEK